MPRQVTISQMKSLFWFCSTEHFPQCTTEIVSGDKRASLLNTCMEGFTPCVPEDKLLPLRQPLQTVFEITFKVFRSKNLYFKNQVWAISSALYLPNAFQHIYINGWRIIHSLALQYFRREVQYFLLQRIIKLCWPVIYPNLFFSSIYYLQAWQVNWFNAIILIINWLY